MIDFLAHRLRSTLGNTTRTGHLVQLTGPDVCSVVQSCSSVSSAHTSSRSSDVLYTTNLGPVTLYTGTTRYCYGKPDRPSVRHTLQYWIETNAFIDKLFL